MSGFWVVKLTRCRLIFGILTVLCMAVIFFFSLDNADAVDDYNELPVKKQMSIMDKAHHIVRKTAHFVIYTMLGFFASCTVGKRRLFGKGSLAALIFCFLYACSDELHQYFVPGRACMFKDVLIDTSGAMLGIIVSVVCMNVFGLIRKRKNRG